MRDRLIKTAELDGIGSDVQALSVRGLMTITDSPPCKCHFCARSITAAYLHAEFHEAFGRGGHVYGARCPDCDVEYTCHWRFDLTAQTSPRAITPWGLPQVDPASLLHQITPEELEALHRKFELYKALGSRWKEFVARMRQGDELWRFRSPADGHAALAVFRASRAIRIFCTIGDL